MKILAALLVLVALLYGAYLVAFPTETIRYRLTIDTTVRGEKRTGTGVIEVTRQDTSRLGAIGGYGYEIRGRRSGWI